MSRLPLGPDKTLTHLYNPTKADFVYPMADDNNIQQMYTLPSRQIVSFPKYIADHLLKHLAQNIALEDDSGLAYEIRYKRAMDKILVTNL